VFRRISLLKPNSYGEISLLLVLSGGYLFGVIYLNLWSDDYAALSNNQSNSIHMLKDARPVSALLLFITFELVKFNLLFVIVFKFLSFLGLLFLARFLARNLQNDIDRKWIVFLTIAIGLSLPSFQVQIHWLHMWLTPWLSILSLYSYKVWCKRNNRSRALAVALLSIVFLAYPPMAFWIFSYGALVSINKHLGPKLQLKIMVEQVTLILMSYVLSAIFSRLILRLFNLSMNERVSFISPDQYLIKIEWFTTRPIATAFRPFMIDSPSPIFAVITAGPFILFLAHFLYKTFWKPTDAIRQNILSILLFSIWLLILPAAHLLVTSNNQYEFRMLPSLNFSVVYLIGIHMFKLLTRHHLFLVFMAILLPAISISLTNIRFQELMYTPFNSKMNFYQNELQKCDREQVNAGLVVFGPNAPFPHFRRLGDFSIISDLEYSWVSKGSLLYFLKVNHIDSKVVPSTSNFYKYRKSSFCRIDLELYRKEILRDFTPKKLASEI
jgi:hypothetical protein